MKQRLLLGIFIIMIILISGELIFILFNQNIENKEMTTTTSTSTTITTTKDISSEVTGEKLTSETTTIKSTTSKTTTSKDITTKVNESTTKKTTTKKTTTKKTTTKKKIVVDTKKETIENILEEKYGSKIIETISKTYDVYDDGTIGNEKTSTKKTFDTSGFNGTYQTMRNEAQSLVNFNMASLQKVFLNVNTYRNEVSVPVLEFSNELSILATIRALEMGWANKFSHTRPDGSSCFTIYDDASFRTSAYGENIAYGQSNADVVSQSWKNSKGHYENMISTDFTKIGVGYANVNGKKYWVQLFAN